MKLIDANGTVHNLGPAKPSIWLPLDEFLPSFREGLDLASDEAF